MRQYLNITGTDHSITINLNITGKYSDTMKIYLNIMTKNLNITRKIFNFMAKIS